MKILILLSALLATTSYALAEEGRPPRCKDPTYACQDLWTARTCGAVRDCIYDVWSTMKAPEDNNEICDICKEMVKEARDQLLSNETQEEIKEVFEGSCELLYLKPIVDECKKIFDDLIPDLIEMLASRMDPNTVCSVAGLCNNAALKGVTLKEKLSSILSLIPSALNDNVCSGCKTLLSAVKKVFTAVPQDEMQEILLHLCQQLPEFAAQCSAMVESYLPVAYNYILSMDPTTTCEAIGVCSESNEIKEPKYGDELTCEFCETLVQYLRDIILTNSTKEEFRKALLNFCSHTGSFSTECKQLVNEYYDMVYDFLDKNLDPEKVCTALGLCQPSGEETAPMVKIVPMNHMWRGKHPNRRLHLLPGKVQNKKTLLGVRVIPAKMNTKKSSNAEEHDSTNEIGGDLVQQLPIERMQNPILTFTQDTECAFSKAIMFFLEKDTKARNSKEITAALDNVCGTWLSSYKKECEHFVIGNRRKVTELLLLGVPFADVTGYLNLCHDEGNQEKAVKDDLDCELCKEVMTYVKSKLAEPKIEDEIRKILDEVCGVLPKSWGSKCQQFVDQYTDLIITFLLEEVDPDTICSALGVCSGDVKFDGMKAVETKPAMFNPVKDSADCEICTMVMNYLEKELEDPTIESGVRQALDLVCSVLPTSYAVRCQQFVDKYTDEIIHLLVQNINPKMVCSLLQECPSENIPCVLCQYALHFLQNQLMSNSTESEIKAVAKTLCSYLPDEIATECDAFIDQYGDAMVVLLAQQLDPSIICPMFKLCPSTDLPKEIPQTPLKHVKLDGCDICKTVVDTIDHLLEEGDVDEKLTDLVAKVCSLLPETAKEECNSIVHLYGPYICQMIGSLESGAQLCQSIELCPRTRGHVHLLGADKCTFGPSYWCQSTAHAAACKAEKYCKQMVWKN